MKAALATLVIFVIGVSVGGFLDSTRFDDARTRLDFASSQADESRLGLLFFQTFRGNPNFCGAFAVQLETVGSYLDKLGVELKRYGEANSLKDFDALKRKYALANVEMWLYSLNFKRSCSLPQQTPVLYFYPDKTVCADCEAQARVLTSLKQKCHSSLLVFSVPADLDIGTVNVLKKQFGVEQYPFLVVGENETVSKLSSAQELSKRFPALAQCA